ncbi:hypothetical protein EZV77_31865 [Burkholderia thailandensis]|nr:hypothetical protein A8H31_11945 [Burkholderia thailandensis]AWY62546.1 hypothetical protein A8H35_19575 [Burkholderia thailandensis]AWY66066.1 hypothetical protein A8H36_04645 [Burkholderia thailandensis]NOK41368.1 hypothetical protein [Burkholderia thailandensis]NOK52518.1 hypothetical protein [Burkholderia thailandensis]
MYLFPAAGAGVAASGRAGDAEFLRGVRRPRVERKAQPPRACPRAPIFLLISRKKSGLSLSPAG